MRRSATGYQNEDISGRFSQLQPNQELTEFYRRKTTSLLNDHEQLTRRLNKIANVSEDNYKIQAEITQRESEIAELQKALSDMQMYLFQEREQVLRLYSENDRLKIRELEDRKNIQHLLRISGLSESEMTYFIKEPPTKLILPVQLKENHEELKNMNVINFKSKEERKRAVSRLEHESVLRALESSREQVKALQSQLEEQTKFSSERLEALNEDRRIRSEENKTQLTRQEEKIKHLMEKAKRSEDLLHDSCKDFLEQRNIFRQSEKAWITEKDRLLRRLEQAKLPDFKARIAEVSAATGDQYHSPNSGFNDYLAHFTTQKGARETITPAGNPSRNAWSEINGYIIEKREEHLRRTIKDLEEQLEEQQKLAEMYRDQVIQLEDDMAYIREQDDVSREVFRDRSEKVTKRLQIMNQRYQELERRRTLEVQGFQTDIKQLRQKLKNIEKQLYKVTFDFSDELCKQRPNDIDLAVLKKVRQTASNSRKLTDELRSLKAMIYGIEDEMKRL